MIKEQGMIAGRKEAGFTLIEIMMALAILGLIMALVSVSFTNTVRARQRIEGQMDLYQMGRLALDTISRDIASAYLSNTSAMLQENEITGFFGKDGTEGDAPNDELHFVTLARSDLLPGPDITEVGYFLTPIKDMDAKFLQRRVDPFPDLEISEGGTVYDLAELVVGLNFRYLDHENQWNDTWDSVMNEGILPQAVEVTINFKGLRGEKATLRTLVKPELFSRPEQQ